MVISIDARTCVHGDCCLREQKSKDRVIAAITPSQPVKDGRPLSFDTFFKRPFSRPF